MINREKLRTGLRLLLVVATISLVVIGVSGWTKSSTQSNKKTIIRPPTMVKEPVAITIKHRGQQIKPNEEFDGDVDWLNNVTLKLTNVSDKTITYVAIHLVFPETATATDASTGLHQIELGVHPDVPSKRAPIILRPGDSMEVSLDSRYANIKYLVERRVPIAKISTVTVRPQTAIFDDGTMFFAGELYHRDPNIPHRWVPIRSKQNVVDKEFSRNDVVEFSEVRVKTRQVDLGQGFNDENEWVKNVALKITNKSAKPITYLTIGLDFPETAATGNIMEYQLVLGQLPGTRYPQADRPLLIAPGDSLDIPLVEHYPKIKAFILNRQQPSDIHKMDLAARFVVFADRTGWSAGNFYKPDPNDANHYINIGDKPQP